MNKIVFYTLLLLLIKYLYKKYELILISKDNDKHFSLLNNHIVNSTKPNIWIIVPNDENSRNWESFGSRKTKNLNAPFVNICIDSTIKHCHNSFNINIIKDDSFSEYIPEWKYDIKNAPYVEKVKLRKLGLVKLVYYYGGLIVPPSFKCEKDLIDLYGGEPISFELPNKSTNNNVNEFLPSIDFFGAKKNNTLLQKLISNYELEENIVTNKIGNILKSRVVVIDGKYIGTKNKNNNIVYAEDLFKNPNLMEYGERYGVLLPFDDLIKKSKYSWFLRMNKKHIQDSNLSICRILKKI